LKKKPRSENEVSVSGKKVLKTKLRVPLLNLEVVRCGREQLIEK